MRRRCGATACTSPTATRRGRRTCVRETLLRAWQHPEVLARSASATRGWLFTVARNIVIDEWRARGSGPST
ncbi:MAG: sigma factor [Nocardioides sp.]